MAKRDKRWWPRVLPELLPFLESPDLSTLTHVVRYKRGAYWHPLVMAQIDHLRGLCEDETVWQEQGWTAEIDDETGRVFPPPEADAAYEQLEALVDAHVRAFLPGREVAPCAPRKKRPGPQGLKNPHARPGRQGEPLIDTQTLTCDFELLRKGLRARAKELRQRRGEAAEEAAQRIEGVVRDVLDASGPHWSTLRKELPDPSWKYDPAKDPWAQPPLLTSTHWNIDVARVVRDLLGEPAPQLKFDEGAPAYVASALLGLLIDVSPQRIYDAVENHRRADRRDGRRRQSQQ